MVSYVTVLVNVLYEGYYIIYNINLRTCHVYWCSMWASIVKCGAVHISLSSPCPSAVWITNFDRKKATTLFRAINITSLVYHINKKVQDGMNVALFFIVLETMKGEWAPLDFSCCFQNCAHAHVVCMCNIIYYIIFK